MVFRKRREKVHITESLNIDNVEINQVDKTKFLGVVIDPHLNFYHHIRYLKGKISRGLGILYRGRKFFNEKTMLTLYNVFIYPYFMYCNEVWGNTYPTYLDPLIKIQKRAIRVVASAKRLSHTDPIFKSLRLLKLKEIHAYSIQLLMFKYHHEKLPSVFNEFFTRNDSIHGYSTRQNKKLHVYLSRSQITSNIVRLTGVTLYNYFLDRIDICCSYSVYKKNLKCHIINNDITSIF